MVYTIPPRNAPVASLGNALGQSFSQPFGRGVEQAAQQQYQQGRLQTALDQLRNQASQANLSPTDLLYNLIEASGYSPEIGRNLPQLFQNLNVAREAQALKNFNFGREGASAQAGSPIRAAEENTPASIPRGQISNQPQFNPNLRQAGELFPNVTRPNESPGNLPQQATQGLVRPVLNGDQLLQKAQERQAQLASLGVVRPFEDSYKQVVEENEQNKAYNASIEQERKNLINSQEVYGGLAEEILRNVYPDADAEEAALFRKRGEEAAGSSKSEADIRKNLAGEARKYKNTLANIQSSLKAPRIQNYINRQLRGDRTGLQQAERDARAAIQPLLKDGLYDRVRQLLSESGFYPEEREKIIFKENPYSVQEIVDSLPSSKKVKTGSYFPKLGLAAGLLPSLILKAEEGYTQESLNALKNNLSTLFKGKENSSVNLLLLRKAYEDRGYDWRAVKDAINEGVESGDVVLTDDQFNQLNSYLNSPPLSNLGKILHGLGFRGR